MSWCPLSHQCCSSAPPPPDNFPPHVHPPPHAPSFFQGTGQLLAGPLLLRQRHSRRARACSAFSAAAMPAPPASPPPSPPLPLPLAQRHRAALGWAHASASAPFQTSSCPLSLQCCSNARPHSSPPPSPPLLPPSPPPCRKAPGSSWLGPCFCVSAIPDELVPSQPSVLQQCFSRADERRQSDIAQSISALKMAAKQIHGELNNIVKVGAEAAKQTLKELMGGIAPHRQVMGRGGRWRPIRCLGS